MLNTTSFLNYLPAFIWLIVVTTLSAIPGVQLPAMDFIAMDKLAHAGVYSILQWQLLRGYNKSEPATRPAEWLTAVFAIGWGILMETMQYTLIPDRYYDVDDMIANSAGVLAAWVAWKVWSLRFKSL